MGVASKCNFLANRTHLRTIVFRLSLLLHRYPRYYTTFCLCLHSSCLVSFKIVSRKKLFSSMKLNSFFLSSSSLPVCFDSHSYCCHSRWNGCSLFSQPQQELMWKQLYRQSARFQYIVIIGPARLTKLSTQVTLHSPSFLPPSLHGFEERAAVPRYLLSHSEAQSKNTKSTIKTHASTKWFKLMKIWEEWRCETNLPVCCGAVLPDDGRVQWPEPRWPGLQILYLHICNLSFTDKYNNHYEHMTVLSIYGHLPPAGSTNTTCVAAKSTKNKSWWWYD